MEPILRWAMTSLSILDKGEVMTPITTPRANQGDAEAIQAEVVFRSIGCLDKPRAEEPKIWELFAEVGMYCDVPKRNWNRKYQQMQQQEP
jgi:hypothetical protein